LVFFLSSFLGTFFPPLISFLPLSPALICQSYPFPNSFSLRVVPERLRGFPHGRVVLLIPRSPPEAPELFFLPFLPCSRKVTDGLLFFVSLPALHSARFPFFRNRDDGSAPPLSPSVGRIPLLCLDVSSANNPTLFLPEFPGSPLPSPPIFEDELCNFSFLQFSPIESTVVMNAAIFLQLFLPFLSLSCPSYFNSVLKGGPGPPGNLVHSLFFFKHSVQ